MADGSAITLNNEEGWEDVKSWFESNPDSHERPTFNFPIEISYDEGEVITINTDEELRAAKEACRGGERPKEDCFEIVYPFTVLMPDGSSIILTEEADRELVKAWHEANPGSDERPELVFPVDITFEDGTTVTITNEHEFRRAKESCKEGDRRENDCFEIVYPFTLIMPDGSSITLAEEGDRDLVKAWHEANPDSDERPELVFPVDITFIDGTTVTVADEDEMHEAKESCKRNG